MSERVNVAKTVSGDAYEIVIESDFEKLAEEISKLPVEGRKCLIVTDSNVGPLYLTQVAEKIKPVFSEVAAMQIPAGEENKTLNTVRTVLVKLISSHFDRKDFILALGGGVVGDLAGFASAVYLRGIKFIQVPTTLLSQTDSSIGGKTGVDFDAYKNMVGAFHQPSLVYMNMSVLKTLPGREFASGMGEILKHGLIRDEEYYSWLVNNFNEITDREPEVLEHMIARSCEIKAAVVEEDPTEQGIRAILNFGHTLGHAIEKYMNFSFTHGECVALGSIAAAWISYKRGNLSDMEFYEIRDMFVPFGLPITLPDDADANKILEISKSDKKMDGKKVKFILLKKPGKAVIDTTVTDDEMLDALQNMIIKLD